MLCIKFELNERLAEFLKEQRNNSECRSFYGPIEDALQERLVPYRLLKSLVDLSEGKDSRLMLESLLQKSRITFRKPLKPESEITRLARQLGEEREYARMMGRETLKPNVRMTEAAEWRELWRTAFLVFNALLSIVGAGVAAYFFARWSLVMSLEASIVCACVTGVVLLIIEILVMALKSNGL